MINKFGNKSRAKKERARKAQRNNNRHIPRGPLGDNDNNTRVIKLMGPRDTKKVAAIFAEIEANEKAAMKLLIKTARAYYDAGNILAAAIRNWNTKKGLLSSKSIADVCGFPEQRVTIALKIYKGFEHNPAALDNLTLRDTLKLITPQTPGEDGYNRIDLGGDPGQLQLDFDGLFEIPAVANHTLQNYRTVGDLISEIVVVRRTANGIISKRFAQFSEDIPQDPLLRTAYKAMSQKTQAAIEDYLAALEQEENRR